MAEDESAEKKNHLKIALSPTEFGRLSKAVQAKLNNYIDAKFEEYLTSKALYESSRNGIEEKLTVLESHAQELETKYEEAKGKLSSSEETIKRYDEQIQSLKKELEKAYEKISLQDIEIKSLKSARDDAIDKVNELTSVVERRESELERLKADQAALSNQLKSAIDTKCEALSANNDMQSKEISLQYREKRMEQERTLLNSQIAGLNEEVNRLTNELQSTRFNYTSRMVTLESQFSEKTEALESANETIAQLNELKNNLNSRAETLTQKLLEQREAENKMVENFKMELEAKTKLADLLKKLHLDAEAKTTELSEGILQLQNLLRDTSEKYGDLETRFKQYEVDKTEEANNYNETINSLRAQLESVNNILKNAHSQNLDNALSDLAPSAAAASKLIKSGMSLTQVYAQLVKLTEELQQEKESNRDLNHTISTIVQELQEKAPLLQKQKVEYQEAVETNTALKEQLEAIMNECNRLRDNLSESTRVSNHYSREYTKLKREMADLARQVCFLLKEIEESRGSQMANGDHNPLLETSNNSEMNSSQVISKTLVTFSDIQELQANNQKLLKLVRELTERQEEFDNCKDQFESGELQTKIEQLTNREAELTEAQNRQTKMVNGLIRQRDMYKKLYQDALNSKGEQPADNSISSETDGANNSQMEVSQSEEKYMLNTGNVSTSEKKLQETEKHLDLLKEEYKVYKEERQATEKLLLEQIESMRSEISKLTAANSKCSATSEYNNERIKILQTNITTYKKQISSLEDKNRSYNETIAKHECSLQHLREEALNAQRKVATAEVAIENLKMECALLKDAESRWRAEKEVLNRERHGQELLLNNLEMIKTSIERNETEGRLKIETRLDEASRECAAMRRRLEEEQNRFRELSSNLERQTETAKERMREEKEAADSLRMEVEHLRKELMEKSADNEQLHCQLKEALTPNTPEGGYNLAKKMKFLEKTVEAKQNEINELENKLLTAQEHVKQYCNISECAEKQLNILSDEYNNYKTDISSKLAETNLLVEQLKEKCSELEAELLVQNNGNPSSVDLKEQLSSLQQELAKSLETVEEMRRELEANRADMRKLSENIQATEEKYANEMVLHSADIQQLTAVKQQLLHVQSCLNEANSQKAQLKENFDANKQSWSEREQQLTSQMKEVNARIEDLIKQNNVLHDQVQMLSTQLSIAHASKNVDVSLNQSGSETLNISLSEDDRKSSDQLFQVIKYLRKEKDIAVAKFDILQAECSRIKSQLEISEKKLDECQLALAEERDKREISAATTIKHSDVLRKVETLNALTDSNRVLREERDSLLVRIQEMERHTKCLDDKLSPLQDQIIEINSKNETLMSENTSLKAETARWRARVNNLVERANKTSPEDWKRLQNERETLAKMLTNEKEAVKKLQDEIQLLRSEKLKLDSELSNLHTKYTALESDNKQKIEEITVLQKDLYRLSEELNKIKEELSITISEKEKISSDLADKEAKLADITNKELQIRKIAKKYKVQFEELTKQTEERMKQDGEQAALNNETLEKLNEAEKKISDYESQLSAEKKEIDKLKSDVETSKSLLEEEKDRFKQTVKVIKTRLAESNELNKKYVEEIKEHNDSKAAFEQSIKDEQEERVSLIKSQYEGRFSRLEKERNETLAERTREIEALMQKVNNLQRQLSSQQSSSKQSPTTEKTSSEPPTANIKPMAGVSSQVSCRRANEPPLASIRPMAQVGPTAPSQHEHTEYMPASSSRPHHRPLAASPPESTQDVDGSEATTGSAGSSDTTIPVLHSQSSQQVVALVMPRVEQAVVGTNATSAESSTQSMSGVSTSGPGVSTTGPGVSTTGPGVSTSGSVPGPGVSTSAQVPSSDNKIRASGSEATSAGVSTSAAGVSTSGPGNASSGCAGPGVSTSGGPAAPAPDARAPKRARPATAQLPSSKRIRPQVEQSEEVEYQVPTSSRCDQEDENVIVVDSEEDDENRCSAGTGTPYQEGESYPDEGVEDEEEEMDEEQEVEEDAETVPHQQEVPPAAPPEPSAPVEVVMGVSGGEEGDDGIVPSTPTLYVPRRNDGVNVARSESSGAVPARFTFTEGDSHQDTLPDLAPALPHGGESSASNPARGGEEADVSSQGSPTHNIGGSGSEEGREAEARRRAPPTQRRPNYDRGRGMRSRGLRRPYPGFHRY